MGTTDTRPTRVRWLTFALIGGASWLLYLHRYAWGVVKPAFKAENPQLTATELGWLDSAFLATYAAGQVPGGFAGDFFGPRVVLVTSILCWSLAVACIGSMNGFWPLFAILAAFGLSQAGTYPSISKVTRNWFPASVRTSVQGAVTSLGRVGAACAPPIIAAVLIGRLLLPWRDCLLIIAVPGVLLALVFWVTFRNNPREHPWANGAEADLIEPAPETTASATPGGGFRSLLHGPARVSLLMLLSYAFFSTFADMLYVFWVPSFLVEGKGLKPADMGWFAPLPLLGGAVGGFVGGTLNDLFLRRTGRSRWARSGVAVCGKTLAAALLLTSLAVGDGRWVMVLLLGCKFFGDWSLPTQWGTITDMAGKGAGTVFGVVNTVGSVGGFAAGPVLGYLKQHFGWDGLFLGVGAAYVCAALCWLWIDCNQRLYDEPRP